MVLRLSKIFEHSLMHNTCLFLVCANVRVCVFCMEHVQCSFRITTFGPTTIETMIRGQTDDHARYPKSRLYGDLVAQ